MKFLLVDVKNISSSLSPEKIDKSKIEKLANSILECNGLLKPLILKQIGIETYTVVSGNTEYYAALKAYKRNPRKAEMVNAFVISQNDEKSVIKQLEILAM